MILLIYIKSLKAVEEREACTATKTPFIGKAFLLLYGGIKLRVSRLLFLKATDQLSWCHVSHVAKGGVGVWMEETGEWRPSG